MKRGVAVVLIAVLWAVLPCRAKAETPDSTAHRSVSEIAASIGGSALFNGAFTELLKGTVHEMRPDRTATNSFPSRHTSWAFTASTVLSNELYRYSPWWSLGGQAVASAVGVQRVMARRHYGSDVICGAALGVASTELAYFISRKIFGSPNPFAAAPENRFVPTFAVYSRAIYWLNDLSEGHLCTGFGSGIDFRLPVSSRLGFTASAGVMSALIKRGLEVENLNGLSLLVGLASHQTLPCRVIAVEEAVQVGYDRLLKYDGTQNGLHARLEGALSFQLTERFAARAALGYEMMTCPRFVNALTVSLASIVCF